MAPPRTAAGPSWRNGRQLGQDSGNFNQRAKPEKERAMPKQSELVSPTPFDSEARTRTRRTRPGNPRPAAPRREPIPGPGRIGKRGFPPRFPANLKSGIGGTGIGDFRPGVCAHWQVPLAARAEARHPRSPRGGSAGSCASAILGWPGQVRSGLLRASGRSLGP
jgi:hypothetical protein